LTPVKADEVIVEVPVVTVELKAAGNVNDYTDEKKDSIADAFAQSAGVDPENVLVTVVAASVIIKVDIQVEDTASAQAVQSDLATELQSVDSATTFLAAANVAVESAPVVVQTTKLVVVVKPPPPSAPQPSPPADGGTSSPTGAIIGGAVGGVAVLIILGALWLKCRQQPAGSTPDKGVQLTTATTSSTSPAKSKAEYHGVTSPLGSPKEKKGADAPPPPIAMTSAASGVASCSSEDVTSAAGDSASARAKFAARSKQSSAARSPRPGDAPASESGRTDGSSVGGWFKDVMSPKGEGAAAAPAVASDRSDLSNVFKSIVGALSPKGNAPAAASAAGATSTTAARGDDYV
jgi:hypothetical protein